MSGMMDCLYAKCASRFTRRYLRAIAITLFRRHTVYYRLRDGRAGETGSPVSCRTKVRLDTSFFRRPIFCCSVARDPRFERLKCSHEGTYADDCLVQRVTSHKCYIVATCDRDLRRRIRQIPGVPLMYVVKRRYAIERLPDQGAPS